MPSEAAELACEAPLAALEAADEALLFSPEAVEVAFDPASDLTAELVAASDLAVEPA